jgi:precorrin-3B synthase
MATGDGLLARVMATGTIALDAFAGLCAAARAHGNGIVEVTVRGSLQVRGLTPASAPFLADAVAALGIEAAEGVPVVADPLAGLDPLATFDAGALAATVRRALARNPRPLAPKTSVLIDGGRLLHLDALAADVRLRADGGRLHVAVGGDGTTAALLGAVASERAAETVVRLLAVLAERGPTARARDVVGAEGAGPFRAAVSGMLIEAPAPAARPAAEPVGVHVLGNGRCAVGIGLPFGYADGSTLRELMEMSRQAEAEGVRPAPGRSLLVVGVGADAARSVAAEAARAGFIVEPGDSRRRIVACPGAPICSSAQIPARALAPALAAVLAAHPGTVHVSGCAKRCASRGPTTYTVIGRDGRCDLFVEGEPAGAVAVGELSQGIARLAAGREVAHG